MDGLAGDSRGSATSIQTNRARECELPQLRAAVTRLLPRHLHGWPTTTTVYVATVLAALGSTTTALTEGEHQMTMHSRRFERGVRLVAAIGTALVLAACANGGTQATGGAPSTEASQAGTTFRRSARRSHWGMARPRPRGLCKTPGVGNGNSCPEILRNLATRRIR